MSMITPRMTALMAAAMMVAMMLPSFAPTLLHYRRHLRAMRATRAAQRTTLFALGYAGVWSMLGVAQSAIPGSSIAPWLAGAIVLFAGALQCSQWKMQQLLRCHHSCVTSLPMSSSVISSLRQGCQLGVHCGASCAALMAILFVAGAMDVRMMLVITAAITAECVLPAGARIAQLTGAIGVIAGLAMCVRAMS